MAPSHHEATFITCILFIQYNLLKVICHCRIILKSRVRTLICIVLLELQGVVYFSYGLWSNQHPSFMRFCINSMVRKNWFHSTRAGNMKYKCVVNEACLAVKRMCQYQNRKTNRKKVSKKVAYFGTSLSKLWCLKCESVG